MGSSDVRNEKISAKEQKTWGWFSREELPLRIRRYHKEFRRPPNPEAEHLRCVVHLDADISAVLPYLNTVLGGHQYFEAPSSLTLKLPGKLVTLHLKQIAINIVKDEAEADAIVEWLVGEVNQTWRRRKEIKPSFGVAARPRALDILKLLPKKNCSECGVPTCMVFAVRLSDRAARLEDCPLLGDSQIEKIRQYLEQFHHASGRAARQIRDRTGGQSSQIPPAKPKA